MEMYNRTKDKNECSVVQFAAQIYCDCQPIISTHTTRKPSTLKPTTRKPTNKPTTRKPTRKPTRTPTRKPTRKPTREPTDNDKRLRRQI
jgi:cell division septation protein DedD